MSERISNLLMDDAAAPDNGLARTRVVQWYGGSLRIMFSGDFDGATATVMFTTRFPEDGDRESYTDDDAYPDTDFVAMDASSGPGVLNLGEVAPCALLVSIENATVDTRIRAVIG